jgi:2-dehydropantoate 2-reductase
VDRGTPAPDDVLTVASIAVLGPGGVGGLIAAALARADEDVLVIAREETSAQITSGGISVQSAVLGTFTAQLPSRPELDTEVDFLIVATKATGLDDALGRVRSDPGLVIPLLNGLEHMDRLRSRFGTERVAAGVIRVESDRPAPAEIVQTSPAVRVDLATDDPALADRLAALAGAIEKAGIAVRTGDSERQVLWSKLARLNALALTTSASDRPIGFVRTDPRWRSALERAVAETVEVANADGAWLDAGETLAELEQAPAELGSSMQRDIAAGREPEVDAIAGSVIRAGTRHGLRCPTVVWLAERVAERAGIPSPA